MRKLVLYGFLGAMCLTLAGCAAANAADDGRETFTVDNDIILENGYYLSDNDNSYIHIEDGFIELCGYDYITDFTDSWNACEGGKVSLEEFIDNSAEGLFYQIEWQEYTPVRCAGLGGNGTDLILLAVHYDYQPDGSGFIGGYVYNDDGTISKVDNIYSYYGDELPEECAEAAAMFAYPPAADMTVETLDSETAEINTAENETVQAETAEIGMAESETVQAETAEISTAESETVQVETTEQ